jgi:carbamoyltransferase
MNILSINFNHDGAGAIVSDGRLVAFAETERFSRKKKHPGIRPRELQNLLNQAALSLADIDHVLLCNLHNMDTPDVAKIHGNDLTHTWPRFEIDDIADTVTLCGRRMPCTVNPEHHALHCALAYYTSPFDSAIAFSLDPSGWGAYIGQGHRLIPIAPKELTFNANIAYSMVAYKLFGTGIIGAGKVMGLAPYGQPADNGTDYERLQTIDDLYALAARQPVWVQEGSRTFNASLAYHVQRGLEVQLTRALQVLHEQASQAGAAPNLCLSGGTALNSVANQIAFGSSPFERLHLHPACGDDGTAIGAALWYWHERLGQPKRTYANAELMYSIRAYDDDVDRVCAAYAPLVRVERERDYCAVAADLIEQGKILGWFHGASEVGPRALGNRSILADPRHQDMKDILNRRVKFREGFRPFAPAVLNEHAHEWFGLEDSPFMLRVAGVRRNGIPAVTHVDGTARLQTVTAADNAPFHRLLQAFYERTGVPLILNTSFNVAGEPIVETPEDAIRSFLRTDLDCLVFRERLLYKR